MRDETTTMEIGKGKSCGQLSSIELDHHLQPCHCQTNGATFDVELVTVE
jgi:hypothetical protein